MIASFFDGRVRIRADALKKPETMDMARSLVQSRPGVLKVESNARTGSLLVHYDPAVITRETLIGAATLLEAQLGGAPGVKRTKSGGRRFSAKTEMFLLTLSYGGMLAGSLLDRRVHVAFGILFSMLTGVHVYARLRKGV
ncbi:MAG: cation transporter [Desulfovibrio sp.]|jgi:hypothetical protein|nr:cation transporter [Desulfovibrio sp.]